MDLSVDLLLSILFVAIIVNSAVMVVFLVTARSRRRRRESAIERTLAASSVIPAPSARSAQPMSVDQAPPAVDARAAHDGTDAPDGRDVLTGLHDAAAFARIVALEESRVARYHRPATIVVLELEGLDRLGQTLGREAAERVVVAVGDTVRRLARDADRVARLAPGRFAVLLAETDEVAAINYVERARKACELWLEAGAIALRLGAGWAGTTGDPALAEAQRVAVERMYGELRRGARRGETDDAEPVASGAEPTRIAS
jgi:diguanylate cyclase (GGDEF)-like protein